MPTRQHLFNSHDQVCWLDRFGKEIGAAGFESGKTSELAGEARKDQNWYAGGGRMGPKGFANGKAIQFRKHQIEENQVGKNGAGFANRFEAIGGGGDRKSGVLKIQAQQIKQFLIVIDQE